MMFFVILACLAAVHVDGSYIQKDIQAPQPYSFGYTIKDKTSVQTREEAGNGQGVVQGAYGIYDNKGIRREVEYVADKGGFRAKIRTNEPGTANQAPAAVDYYSNDPYAQGSSIVFNSIPNVPYVPALALADPKYGFPTVNDFRKLSIQKTDGPRRGPVFFGVNLVGGELKGYNTALAPQYAATVNDFHKFSIKKTDGPRIAPVYFGVNEVGGKLLGYNTLLASQYGG